MYRRWFPPILWGLIILVLSLMPGGAGNLLLFGIPYMDKIGHFGMYGIWTFLTFRALTANESHSPVKSVWMSIGIGTLAGIILEIGQLYIAEGRSFELADMVANTGGAAAGALTGLVPGRKSG